MYESYHRYDTHAATEGLIVILLLRPGTGEEEGTSVDAE